MDTKEKSTTPVKPQDRYKSANWYRALTLAERVALLTSNNQLFDASIPISEQSRQRLGRWKEQRPFNEGTYFEQRLALMGLNEEQFLQLINLPPEVLQASSAGIPEWLRWLFSVFQDGRLPDKEMVQALDDEQNAMSRSFLAALVPLLSKSWKDLQAGIDQLEQRYTHLPFDRKQISATIFANLPSLLLHKAGKTFILELNVARVQGQLQGDTPEQRFQSFIRRLCKKEHMLDFLEEYAVLARLLVEGCMSWLETQLELLERICLDWEVIRETFCPDTDPGILVEIQSGKGDTHRGGRSVATLRWNSGFHLVYKPRSFATDIHFKNILSWLNEKGFQPEFRSLKMLDRGTYGWVEFISPSPCNSVEDVERFYKRQGGYLALLYALHAGDFHADNLIACGEHPFLIDLEVLFLPQVKELPRDETSETEEPELDAPPHTVLHVGMLPNRIWSGDDNAGVDISALGGKSGQLSPVPVAVVQGAGTDEMRIEHERLGMVLGQNLPTLQNEAIDVAAYSGCLVAGFADVYRLMLAHREEFQTRLITQFAEVEVRCLPRNTQLYDVVLEHSYHPNMLRDALERDRLFDRLWFNTNEISQLKPLFNDEVADLWEGDIPFFYTGASTHNLYNGHGGCIPEFFERSGIELVQEIVTSLNEADLERQCWITRSTFINLGLPSKNLYPSLKFEPTTEPYSRERVLATALAAGDRLLVLKLENGEFLDWLSIATRGANRWGLYPSDIDLYNGQAGIIFYLAYLGNLTGEEKYSVVAKHALRMLRRQVKYRLQQDQRVNIGGYSGIGAYVYLLSHLGTLWNDPALFAEAEKYVETLAQEVRQDEMYDMMGGAAGCIAALLSLYHAHPSEATLAAARICGERLLEKSTPQEAGIGWITAQETVALAGMAHGNAGIALNLLRLAHATGDQRFTDAALQAFAYERYLFSPEMKNWPDLRTGGEKLSKQDMYRMTVWCHGAAGIALARMGCLRYHDDEAIRQEIETGLQTTLAKGLGNSHSLCHGDLGNIDILLTATEVLGGTEYLSRVESATPKLLDSIARQGWVSGGPMGLETPGMMLGLSGAGYTWLRLAFPGRVPSVLLLEPPIVKTK
ncbi:type 2 lanthipeptide synthetase LanM family protein [Ktedonospora formicarum]|uniref:Lanthionine synthetase n=1 Tax=Ktedonospora formicarum TaxID=2778364 RepID=A0A8J3MT10_9CHLR|nr:type 2 lanthipeptide synthetase LanM family protein [Ktedonospora formicarum]GHO45401.1 lanthionine synthetase [Ktedonospora formicarum]